MSFNILKYDKGSLIRVEVEEEVKQVFHEVLAFLLIQVNKSDYVVVELLSGRAIYFGKNQKKVIEFVQALMLSNPDMIKDLVVQAIKETGVLNPDCVIDDLVDREYQKLLEEASDSTV